MTDLRKLFAQARSNIESTRSPATAPMTGTQDLERIERGAAALPAEGPLNQIVLALDEVLTALVELDATRPDTWTRTHYIPFAPKPDAELSELVREPVTYALRVSLFRLGQHAHRLTGCVDTVRAIHFKAANMAEGPRAAEYRRDVLDQAWRGIGDTCDCWAA